MFVFSPLQGAFSDSSASQSLLELDGGVKVLIGLGWDESFDPTRLEELEKYRLPYSLASSLLRSAFLTPSALLLDSSRISHFH